MGRGSRGRINKKCLFMIERIECCADFQKRKLGEMKKINLASSECRILEMTGRAGIVFPKVFLSMKEIYE